MRSSTIIASESQKRPPLLWTISRRLNLSPGPARPPQRASGSLPDFPVCLCNRSRVPRRSIWREGGSSFSSSNGESGAPRDGHQPPCKVGRCCVPSRSFSVVWLCRRNFGALALLPLPARHEWGEDHGEGYSDLLNSDAPPLPGPVTDIGKMSRQGVVAAPAALGSFVSIRG